ncbi:molecular chaperone, partial [uncultured Adlercreutzia sp.]
MTTIAPEEQNFFDDLANLCEQRAATYELLSRLYRKEVDEELLEVLSAMRFPAATGNVQSDRGHRLIASYLSQQWDNTLTELAVDYVRAFIGNTNELDGAAFPFESVYTSEKRLLMQQARDEVLAIYRAFGIDKDPSWREGEDHIALELEFMGTLCRRTADALRQGDEEAAFNLLETQRNFLGDHVGAWAPLLTVDMRHFAKTDFYRGLACMTDGFLESDGELLADVLTEA